MSALLPPSRTALRRLLLAWQRLPECSIELNSLLGFTQSILAVQATRRRARAVLRNRGQASYQVDCQLPPTDILGVYVLLPDSPRDFAQLNTTDRSRGRHRHRRSKLALPNGGTRGQCHSGGVALAIWPAHPPGHFGLEEDGSRRGNCADSVGTIDARVWQCFS